LEKIENALLATMLSDGALGDGVQLTRLNLPSGPLQEEQGEWVYFPVDALISWVPTHSMQGAVALVGHRGCVVLPPTPSAPVQVHVISPGHAYRLDWTLVRQDSSRFAPWLWHTTAAAQSLIAQMAQWSFCAQHHSPSQHLASWLLHGLAQSSKPELLLGLQSLPRGMQDWLNASVAEDAQAVKDPGYIVKDGRLRTTNPAQLLDQACSCHASMAHPNSAPL
jgi:hypothetical protein